MKQIVLRADEKYSGLNNFIIENGIKRPLLVCDNSIKYLRINEYFKTLKNKLNIEVIKFDSFKPNPTYESVVKGVEDYHKNNCDAIIAVGGGSAIDVAKCIKLYSNMNTDKNYLNQKIIPNDVKFIAVPTTAGTGSESTRFAVIYFNGEKQSVTDSSCIPAVVVMDTSVLKTLPEYQKKATMMDALCHAVESFWSVNSTDESKEYSRRAIQLILRNKDLYLSNDDAANENMLKAANIAGKAINITQTTAGHAMCYKLTSLYGIAHGHAAALCTAELFKYMILHTDKCIDKRGKGYLKAVFGEIAKAMNCKSAEKAAEMFSKMVTDLGLSTPIADKNDFSLLKKSVNPDRLKNNPVYLDEVAIDEIYHKILNINGEK